MNSIQAIKKLSRIQRTRKPSPLRLTVVTASGAKSSLTGNPHLLENIIRFSSSGSKFIIEEPK